MDMFASSVLAIAPLAAAAVVVGAIAAAAAVVEGVKGLLDSLGFDRSCILEIVNATDEWLTIEVAETESGAFHTPPPAQIAPRTSVVFTAGSRFAGEGASGHTTVTGNGFHFFMDWSNPFIGSNDIDAEMGGDRAHEFHLHTAAGGGATGAHLRCDFFYSNIAIYESELAPEPAPGVEVPNVVGWGGDEARTELQNRGFAVFWDYDDSTEEDRDIVLWHDPGAGSWPPGGSTVRLHVGAGPPPENPEPFTPETPVFLPE